MQADETGRSSDAMVNLAQTMSSPEPQAGEAPDPPTRFDSPTGVPRIHSLPSASQLTDRVFEVDLLRFVAAVAVVFFHWSFRGAAADGLSTFSYPSLWPTAQYGYLGVDLFFMISGFVIIMTASSGSLKRFVASRIARLYPAFWACCTITAVVAWLWGQQTTSVTFVQYLINLTMLSGFVHVPSVDGAYWSLFVEIRFYAWVALALAIGLLPRLELLLWLWLAVTGMQRVVAGGPLYALMIAQYAPFFIGGACCYLMRIDGIRASRLLMFVLSFGLATHESLHELAQMAEHYTDARFEPAWVIGGVVLIHLLMLGVATRRLGWLASPWCQALGTLTYPLYLLHQNIGYIVLSRLQGLLNPHLLFWTSFTIMLAAAFGVHRLIERPLSRSLKMLTSRGLDRLAEYQLRRIKKRAAGSPTM